MSSRLFLHTPEPASSPALYVYELARSLTASGLPVHVVCPANHQARNQFEQDRLITVHLSRARATRSEDTLLWKIWENLRFLLSSCFALLRNVREGDIVHFQYVLHFPFGALLFLIGLARRCRIVFTVHDPLPHKWLLPASLRWLEKGALAWSYQVSDVLLVHSEAGKRTLVQHFPQVAERIRVIVHGPYRFGGALPPRPQSAYLEILFFGALRENKAPHLAIQAVQQLRREGIPVRLTIAGGVFNRREQAYWDKCRELIADYPDPIHLQEQFVPDEDLPALFGHCHCLLLPYTQFSSDSGVAYMALANGRPIVSTTSGGLGFLLESSGGGVSIEQATIDGVALALRRALNLGPENLEEMGRVGQAWVLQECGWPRVAAQTRKIYETCLRALNDEPTLAAPAV